MHKLFEFVSSLGQRQHNVNGHVGRLHKLTFHFHEGAEGAEENQPAELLFLLATEGQLVQRALVLFSALYACRDEKTLRTVKKRNHFPEHPHGHKHKQSKIQRKLKDKLRDKYHKDKHTNMKEDTHIKITNAGFQKIVINLLTEKPRGK